MQTRITPEPGKIYLIRHPSGCIRARFLATKRRFTYHTPYRPERANLHYVFLNIRTNRKITLKSRAKIIATV